MLIQLGDVVFFKKVTKEVGRRAPEIGFKGATGFGVMLGIVPPGTPAPQTGHLMSLMGQSGYVALDDVKEFLGDESLQVLLKKFTEKYSKLVAAQTPKPKLIGIEKEIEGQP